MAQTTTLQIARQPIFDRSGTLAGFELLYRDGKIDGAEHADALTRTVRSVEALIELGLDRLVGDVKAFLNVDFAVVDYPIFDAVPTEKIVLEILESTEPTEANLQRTKDLKDRGFTLALDDYAFQDELLPFLPLVDIVKLECSVLNPDQEWMRISKLAAKKRCLAEKLEDLEQYKRFKDMGCDLFQGYYFAKPKLMAGNSVASNKTALLMLLTRLNDEHVSLAEIESIVASDVSFTYKLLKIIHSAGMGGSSRIRTVREAILYLGLRPTASLASLFLASAAQENAGELMSLALSRGKMCEELARLGNLPEPESYFSVGLLSVLDAFLNRPMPEILSSLPLTEEMQKALLNPVAEVGLGGALLCAMAYERGDFEQAARIGFQPRDAQEAYSVAIEYATATRDALKAA